jgi:hypothetical protein
MWSPRERRRAKGIGPKLDIEIELYEPPFLKALLLSSESFTNCLARSQVAESSVHVVIFPRMELRRRRFESLDDVEELINK